MFVNIYLPFIAQARACLCVIAAKKVIRIFISKGFVTQKQVKINAGKIERRFGVVMTPFSSSKMIQKIVSKVQSFKSFKVYYSIFISKIKRTTLSRK